MSRAATGRRVKPRNDIGFANDLRNLDRLRTALRLTKGLDPTDVRETIECIDLLQDKLSKYHDAVFHEEKPTGT